MTRRPRAALRRRWGRRIVLGVTVLGILALVGAIAWHGLGADDAGGAAPVPDSLPVGAEHVVVERVVDGDTVHVRRGMGPLATPPVDHVRIVMFFSSWKLNGPVLITGTEIVPPRGSGANDLKRFRSFPQRTFGEAQRKYPCRYFEASDARMERVETQIVDREPSSADRQLFKSFKHLRELGSRAVWMIFASLLLPAVLRIAEKHPCVTIDLRRPA
ncbi:hypothetical protein SAMN06295924_12314 [Rathayibacter rathayi NCPPB 2980 = VKM Ac-1601]|nr:hypothetical protein FB469_0683 [Rathayibacter rathayi]SOE06023.1 hypothetical protein SAMN06295924_12314 [Rathayibacter rathayi NCPPB 2980 = VKM Ac-1601]